jgi:uncharacterized protein YecT (DUF1311 family)
VVRARSGLSAAREDRWISPSGCGYPQESSLGCIPIWRRKKLLEDWETSHLPGSSQTKRTYPNRIEGSRNLSDNACLQQLCQKIKIRSMHRFFFAACFLLTATSMLCQPTQSACWKTAMAQSEMNRCADLDARAADADLNHVYQKLLAKLKGDDNATKKLRAAQRSWLAFRDTHLQELYPAEDKQAEYGSIFPMCYSQVATAMTRERTAQLRRMLSDKDPCDTTAISDQRDEGLATEHLIREALKQISELRPGDSRMLLERNFEQDGGLQFARHSRYVLKKCQFIKVDVEFSGEGIDNRAALPSDTVVRVSRPYVEYPSAD